MRFGYCTGFAAGMTGEVNYGLLDEIEAAGYDFVEFPLMQLEALSPEGFERLKTHMASMRIACDACCNMFPAHVRLLGGEADDSKIRGYLDVAFARMEALGVKKVVLGSSGARNLPDGMSRPEGVQALSRLISEVIVPYLDASGILLLMEPIGSYEANFINTLPDGMEVVNAIRHPRVALLADSVHLLYENESPEHIVRFAPYLQHIHLCEAQRALPVNGLSDGLSAIADALKQIGYSGTFSFEPMPHTPLQMRMALENVKSALAVLQSRAFRQSTIE